MNCKLHFDYIAVHYLDNFDKEFVRNSDRYIAVRRNCFHNFVEERELIVSPLDDILIPETEAKIEQKILNHLKLNKPQLFDNIRKIWVKIMHRL
jgi:hypothetical protein